MSHNVRFDVTGIGNAIVDVLSRADDDLLVAENIAKGSMHLIDEDRADDLYQHMGATVESSGGSAANTIAGIAGLGGQAAFIGRVKDDALGKIFRHDIIALGAAYPTQPSADGPGTGRCLILVTPDGERTMNTYLGAAQDLEAVDVDEETIASSAILYLEGYLWDPPAAKEAFLHAADIAHKNGRKVALTLSDSFCVERYRSEFLNLLRDNVVDIVFANEHEVRARYETADLDTAIGSLGSECEHSIVTRGAEGASIVMRGMRSDVPAHPVQRVDDLTGAGDLFAAGYLTGWLKMNDVEAAARLAGFCAAETIQHMGARPQINLEQAAQSAGFLPA